MMCQLFLYKAKLVKDVSKICFDIQAKASSSSQFAYRLIAIAAIDGLN